MESIISTSGEEIRMVEPKSPCSSVLLVPESIGRGVDDPLRRRLETGKIERSTNSWHRKIETCC